MSFGSNGSSRSVGHSRSMVLTINEDDAASLGKLKIRRCLSLPQTWIDVKSIMKCRTLDESLHSTYGSEAGSRAGDRSIQFGHIVIREYARTVGDNPSCSSGPPVAISWAYKHLGSMGLEEYEDTRPPRRSHFEMVLPRKVRQDMLRREWDVTQRQIADAVRSNIKVKNQRKATINNLGKATKFEEVVESAARKFKRALLFQRRPSEQVKRLEAQLNEANRLRSQMKLNMQMASEYGSENQDSNPRADSNEAPGVVESSTSCNSTPTI